MLLILGDLMYHYALQLEVGLIVVNGVCEQVHLTVGTVGPWTNLVVITLVLECLIQGVVNL